MRDKPVDLQELFRRAITAQIELGTTEIVLSGNCSAKPGIPEAMHERAKRITTVAEAIQAPGPKLTPEQAVMQLFEDTSYSSLEEHCRAIGDCQLCPLGATRTNLVYGIGDPHARLMFIGEAPGADEDRLGEPFVGRAGKLLDRILAAIELSRDVVYIGNILKCRPPGNRDPQPDEMARCLPHLLEQIRLIRPRILCLLGRVAAQVLLRTTTPLGKLRGRWLEFEGIPTMVTYHPAALLRFPAYKKDTWADMQVLKARYDQLT